MGLQGTVRGLVIIYFTLTIPMIVWVMTSFFSSLPRTVEAAARVDGNTRLQAFYRVILPMSWPGIAVATAISFMVCWNEFAFAQFLAAGSDGPDTAAGHLRRCSSRSRSRPRWRRPRSSPSSRRRSWPISSNAEFAASIWSIRCSGAEYAS